MDRLPLPTSKHAPLHPLSEEEEEEADGTTRERSASPISQEGVHSTQWLVQDQWIPTGDDLDRENRKLSRSRSPAHIYEGAETTERVTLFAEQAE